jgi:hypothetical protein
MLMGHIALTGLTSHSLLLFYRRKKLFSLLFSINYVLSRFENKMLGTMGQCDIDTSVVYSIAAHLAVRLT